MGGLISTVSHKWASWTRERQQRALEKMQADVKKLELVQVERIAAAEDQIAGCERRMEADIQAHVDREPTARDLAAHLNIQRTRDQHERDLASAQLQLNNCHGVYNHITNLRNSADDVGVMLSKIATQLDNMKHNPQAEVMEAERRDMRTAEVLERQRAAHASIAMGTGPTAINAALQKDHMAEHIEAQTEDAQLDAELTGKVSPVDAIKAKFAAARVKHTQGLLNAMPLPTGRSAVRGTKKSFGTRKYEQLEEMDDDAMQI